MTNLHTNLPLPELLKLDLFSGMSKLQIQELCIDGKVIATTHRECLFSEGTVGDFFGVVLSGAYKITKASSRGEDVIINFVTPGDIVAALIMAQANPIYPVSVISMGPSRFLRLSRSNYVNTWKSFPGLLFKIQNLLLKKITHLHDQKTLYNAPLNQKIAAVLIALLEKNASNNPLELPFPLTRKEIANAIGSTEESVIRIMSDWTKVGFIQTTEQFIRIIQVEKILEILKV